MKYRSEIDGLRSLAVLPVILFHARIQGFSGGYVGVDIFFVISGYLITRILAGEMQEGRYSLLGFYERRFRRILPALVVMLVVATAIAWRVLPPLEMLWYGESLAATALFVANFYFLFRGGNYFGGLTDEYPLLHTWSLAVEEQFYIFFPLLLWAIWRLGWRRVLGVIAGLSVLSFLGAEILSRIDQPANFYLLPTRAWELGAGAVCALLHHHTPRRQSGILSLAGLVLILGSIVLLPAAIRFPSVFALPPVIGTALIVLYAGPETRVGRFLSLRPLVAVGLASYSAYLWHQPLFAFAHVRADAYPGTWAMLALSALSVALGFLSLRFVEAPFRRRGSASAAQVVAVSGGVLVSVAALGLALHLTHGAAFRPAPAPMPRDYYAVMAKPDFPSRGIDGRPCEDFCKVTEPAVPRARVLLVGDSHAQDLIAGMTRLAASQGWELTLFINTGCTYTRMTGGPCHEAAVRLLDGLYGYDRVVLVNRLSGMPQMLGRPEGFDAQVSGDYMGLVRAALDTGAQVTLFEPRLIFNRFPVRVARAGGLDSLRPGDDFAGRPAWQAAVAALEDNPRLTVIDQNAILTALGCGARDCFNGHTPDGHPIYRDGHHLTAAAAQVLVDRFAALVGAS